MEGKLSELIRKARDKYKRDFKQLYFDNGLLDFALRDAVDKIPEDEKLKIFISGEGDTGIQYITNDKRTRKQTVKISQAC